MLPCFSLSWVHHNQNICKGLSTLQQNGELVDMTLAADGHMVKVHQIVMSLISPYMKELILSANCPHPVIFLNNVSYNTLRLILEFIYEGEVLVEKELLPDLVQAGTELHIQGLQDFQKPKPGPETSATHKNPLNTESHKDKTMNNTENASNVYEAPNKLTENLSGGSNPYKVKQHQELQTSSGNGNTCTMMDTIEINDDDDNNQEIHINKSISNSKFITKIMPKAVPSANITDKDDNIDPSMLQYTVSCQGSLQVILNKFIYYLRYKSKSESKHNVYRCVEYVKHRCPAYIVCRGSNVLRRVAMHTHPNHEHRIRKKVMAGEIFDSIKIAEEYGADKKQ